MKIVIDIPEEEYKCVQITGCIGNETCIANAIYNGTPLPKGHGRMIILSKDKLKENQIDLDFSCQKWISEVGLSNATVAAIEADRAESEEIEALEEPKAENKKRLTNAEWKDFLSEQFGISRTSAAEMLHGMMRWKGEDNFKKQFSGSK